MAMPNHYPYSYDMASELTALASAAVQSSRDISNPIAERLSDMALRVTALQDAAALLFEIANRAGVPYDARNGVAVLPERTMYLCDSKGFKNVAARVEPFLISAEWLDALRERLLVPYAPKPQAPDVDVRIERAKTRPSRSK